jgi:hypothetical protein
MAQNNRALTRIIARKASVAHQKAKKQKERDRQRRIRRIAAVVCAVAAVTASLCLERPDPIPMHTSVLTGQLWLNELLAGHPTRFREQLGMAKHAFLRLSTELQMYSGLAATKFVSANEKLATFLYFARTGSSSRMLRERFQRSADTIHRYSYFYDTFMVLILL